MTTTSWDQVFAILIAPDKGNCASVACHGTPALAANGILLPADDEVTLYETLVTTTDASGRPYVNRSSPLQSWMHCNVTGAPGGGLIMPTPSGLRLAEDVARIEDWLASGAPGPSNP
jgi:hypothetical protein